MKEKDETPQMEARSHSAKFLKTSFKAKLSKKAASAITKKVKAVMGKGY